MKKIKKDETITTLKKVIQLIKPDTIDYDKKKSLMNQREITQFKLKII